MKKKICLASDHRGFEMKQKIAPFLEKKGYEVVDCGAYSAEASDYPDFILEAAEKVGAGVCALGIGICYTGIGSTIAANKVPGIRAALCRSVEEARLSRQHNDANMLVLGAGFIGADILFDLVETWLTTAFEGGRHERRVNKIKNYERKKGNE
jgi:ribose 5-phosphate isomerase B